MSVLKRILAIGIPSAAALTLIGMMAVGIYRRDQTIYSLRSTINAERQEGSSEPDEPVYEPINVDHHYDLLGHKIYLSDDTYGEIWLPVLADVPLSTHPLENMTEQKNKRMRSVAEDGSVNAMTGADLSSHNVITDWSAVKADGIDFVMLRLGYRGYVSGKLMQDDNFNAYYNAAKNAGLKVGAYFFSQAISEEEAVEEAVFAAKILNGRQLDFPVAFDWELIFNDDEDVPRTDNVPVDVLTDACLAFCQNMESFGYRSMIYQNKRTSLFKLDLPRLQDIPFWLAEYGDGPTYIYDYDMWQYSCKGTVDGIEGEVDLNLSFYDYSQEGEPAVSIPASSVTTDTTGTEEPAETTETTTAADDE